MTSTSKVAFTPFNGRILIKKDANQEETTSGGLIIAKEEKAGMSTIRGVVVGVGPGKVYDGVGRIELPCKVGDHVIFVEQGHACIRVGDDVLYAIDENQLIGKYES